MRILKNTVRSLASAPKTRALLAMIVVPALLGGCVANRVTEYSEVQGQSRTELMWVSLEHDVGFDVGQSRLSDAEAARLDQFLSEIEIRHGDNLVIDPGSFRGGIVEPRVESVADYFGDRLPAMPYQVAHLGWEESDEAFRIIVGRYLVIPPKCPNLESSTVNNPNNLRASNYGCATETNLALMIANPADLLHGQPYRVGDGMVIANSVARYRAGATEAVDQTSATDAGE